MINIHPLSEGTFTVGHDKNFLPFRAGDDLHERSRGSLLVEVQPFLLQIHHELLLFDTGLGFPLDNGEMQIHQNIRNLGFHEDQIDHVLLSHLHKDHAGGLVKKTKNGAYKPAFPNALYHFYRPEVDWALQQGQPSYHPEEIETILQSGQVNWLDGESGNITQNVRFTHTGGHCPQHIVFQITDQEQTVFFGGDEAPQLKQMKMKYVAKYDYDGRHAMELRHKYAKQGRAEGWKFLFYHDIVNAIASFT